MPGIIQRPSQGGSPGWTAASGTHLGGGSIADAGSTVSIVLPAGTPAVVKTNGLAGMLGAQVWDLGEAGTYTGPVAFGITPVTWVSELYLAVGVAVAAAVPTDLAGLDAAEHHFGQLVRRVGFGEQKVTTHIRTNGQDITDGTNESRTDTQVLAWSCSVGPDRFGGGKWWHHWPSGGQSQPQTGTLSAALTSGHRVVPFLAWGSREVVAADKTLVLSLSGRPV